MNRKSFFTHLFPLGIGLPLTTKKNTFDAINNLLPNDESIVLPGYLKKGDTIGITSPAGAITYAAIQPAVKKMEEWGFAIKIGNTIGKKDFTFGGTDEERSKDFQQMLDDDSIKAIMCARGGYGTIRIIDQINFKRFIKKPKWIIGFSDATVLHSHINRNCGVASIHSKMCNSFPSDWSKTEATQIDSIESIRKCLTGEKISYPFSPNEKNKTGIETGTLVGGNLSTIESLLGSKSDINTQDKILFIEDTDEYLYSIDRMLWSLKRSGKLSGLSGLIVGGFNIKTDDETEPFGKTIEELVLEKVAEYGFPVCFDFPVGHQKNNIALKCGAKYKLSIHLNECSLTEIK